MLNTASLQNFHSLHDLKIKVTEGAFKYYISTFGEGGGMSQNADTAKALEMGAGVLAKMMTCWPFEGKGWDS